MGRRAASGHRHRDSIISHPQLLIEEARAVTTAAQARRAS
jgi:hypothetical protein